MAEFIDVVAEEDLIEGSALVVEVEGREVALVRTGGEIYAIQNECPHAGSSLGEGEVIEDGILECPGHGATFNVVSGEVVGGPATENIETYEVRVIDGKIQVAI